MPHAAKWFDLVGVGLNATDTLLLVDRYPALGGKVGIRQEIISCGGQIASALAAVTKLGLRAKYIGTVGDDARGQIQLESLRGIGMDIEDVEVRKGCANQAAFIVVDGETGERTIFWMRPDCLAIDPERITAEMIGSGRMLLVDGHDTPAVERAARLARETGVKVTVDVDTVYPGFERVLPYVDYLISSSEFPARWTGERDPFEALKMIQAQHPMPVAGMTLGRFGALALADGTFHYSPGFQVNSVDTTGAGDIFHAGFCYAVLDGMPLAETLDFANAMAALSCTKLGARGGLATRDEVRTLLREGTRNVDPDLAAAAGR